MMNMTTPSTTRNHQGVKYCITSALIKPAKVSDVNNTQCSTIVVHNNYETYRTDSRLLSLPFALSPTVPLAPLHNLPGQPRASTAPLPLAISYVPSRAPI